MDSHITLLIAYIIFVYLIILHTFEEIAQGVFALRLGHLQLTLNRYFVGAGALTTLNFLTLALLILQQPLGYYTWLFMAAIPGVFQGIIHTWGFLKLTAIPPD